MLPLCLVQKSSRHGNGDKFNESNELIFEEQNLKAGNSNQTTDQNLTESLNSSEPEINFTGHKNGRISNLESETKHHIRI
ncbi:uncharacterized protein LOC121273867 isoform X2 [Carcharodon carcharias]|uniref:uncharacterized protein LOC121273867 isoform X2 n=1 Tax=Carcharodon carcharias TaxID=13397 RepID=UPI001B7D9156|nr:uncharacterized protein LOC121273867 isoform X2 [Carcharodon carcharias]